MIINGRSVQVLVKFIEGLNFERNDLMYYNNNIYIALDNFIGTSTPDNSPKCELYLKNHGPQDIITSDELTEVLAGFIRGLRPSGYLELIDDAELDGVMNTSIYQVSVNNAAIAPYAFRGILRCYMISSSKIVQELVDFGTDDRTPNLYYRTYNGSWSAWTPILTVTADGDEGAFAQRMLDLSDKLTEIVEEAELYNNLVKVAPYKFLEQDALGRYTIDQMKGAINVIISYAIDGTQYQESFSFDPDDITSSAVILGKNKSLTVTIHESLAHKKFSLTVDSGVNVLKVILIQA